jgi:hypothetical protein
MARIFISHSSRDDEAAAKMKAWLASQGFETAFLDFDKTSGIPPGADWEKTLYREVEQSQAVIIIQTPNWLASKWCFAEFTQARALGKAIFLVIETPTGDAQISPDIQTLNLISDRAGGLERLSHELVRIALDAQGGFAWDASRPPFPGLLAFEEEDAALYFGRDDDIRRLIERCEARRAQGGAKLIALLGSSGSGKSSLLRAGVIPRLKRAGRNWIVIPPMRPRLHPVDALALALAAASGPGADWRKLRDDLVGSDPKRSLQDLANDLRVKAGAADAQVLIPIDQGEELFGVADPDEARRFLEVLSQALSESLSFMAVMAIRSDFLGQLQSAAALMARFEEFSLGPMPLARISQIIQGPAKVAGVGVEEAFVQQAARDAATEDALPLLAFALRELWDRSPNKLLSLDGYNALGDEKAGLTPLENAVRKAADGVLAEAKPGDDELTALREAFVPAMVRVNDQGEYVRRPARLDELPAKAQPLLERLAKARLLIVRQDGDAPMVEVAHEALLRKWPLLRSWLDAARGFLIGKQQLEQDLRDWEGAADKDKAGALLTGLKLSRARGWLVEHPNQLNAQERAFIQASIERAEAETRRNEWTRGIITWGSLAAALVLAVVAVWAGLEAWRANAAEKSALESEQHAQKSATAALESEQQAKAAQKTATENESRALAALSDAQLAHKQTATELIRYAWIDLGAKQDERDRLTKIAQNLPKEAQETILRPPFCANADCTETKIQQPGNYDCETYLEFGFRYLYCSIRSALSFDRIQSIAGLKIYLPGGPHDGKELNLKHPVHFGHYNPEFLDWVDRNLIPDRSDPWFRGVTQRVYDETSIGETVRALYRTHRILFLDSKGFSEFQKKYQAVKRDYQDKFRRRLTNEAMFESDPQSFEDVKRSYQNAIASGNESQIANTFEQFGWLADYFSAPDFKPGDDYYLEDSFGGFWVRRSIDGTEPRIFQLVIKLLSTFDPSVLANP